MELSGPPMDGPLPAITAMAADRAVLRAAFAEAGLGLVLLGADPLRPAKRVNPGDRYRAMEQFFAASQTGAAGAAMMTSTASVQVNLEAGPQAGWAARVRLAHALGPTMIAIAANSPLLGGKFTGWRSSRQWVWSQLDSARCGPILGASGDDPASDWARYAMKAPVMLVHPTPEMDAVPVTDWVPFADWADGRVLLGDRRPTDADLDYHLTTLFPPVRPRRFLEIRYLDSVPDAVWPAVVFTLTTLLDDPVAADIAAEATEPVATAWDRAAQIGLGDRRLHEAANRCVQTAAERAPAELEESMQRLVRSVEQGRCPADDFSDRVVKNGIARRGQRTGARGAVTARETLARELTKARDRTLRLVEFDDAELGRQYDPLMSPLVWDLAHIGQQEELWLLRGGNPRPAGHAVARGRAALRRVRALAGQPGRPAAAAAVGGAGLSARRCATRRSTPSTRCPTTTPKPASFHFGMVISHENQHDETMLQALNLRSGPPLLDAGHAAAPGPARRGRHIGAGARRPVRPRRRRGDRAVLAGQRAARARRRRARLPHRPGPGHQRRMAAVRRRRRLPAAAVVVRARLGAPRAGRADRTAVLERRRHPHPVRPRRGHSRRRAGAARHVLRGRGLRGLGRRAAAHRGGVGEGVRVGSDSRRAPALPVGRVGAHRRIWPTSAATRCGPRRSAPTRRARRPTAPSRCSATCGSGPRRRCGRGPVSPR